MIETIEQALAECSVFGNVVKPPAEQLDKKLYGELKKRMENSGGVWKGGKTFGFIFKTDPTELLKQLQSGEVVNLKKEFQFFETPDALADKMVYELKILEGHYVLEPSAGQGALIKAIYRDLLPSEVEIHICELSAANRAVLNANSLFDAVMDMGHDFLTTEFPEPYDRIIANPPFSGNQDTKHIERMYRLLKSGGRMVTVCSKHPFIASGKTEKIFCAWLEDVGAKIESVPAGTFKESGTSIETVLITIDKP